MRRTSEEIEYKSHNLWLKDESLECFVLIDLKKNSVKHEDIALGNSSC